MGMNVGVGGVKSEPNVVPMIDVMLVLLIIFMIAIPQINAGFTAIPPDGQNVKPHPEEDNDQVLGIDANGAFYLNKQPVRDEDLEAAVGAIFQAPDREEFIMYVKAHKDLPYLTVINALDRIAKAGVRVAALITEQKPGTESLVESDRISGGGGQ
jgi:biopolymer transport protein ExbD